MEGRSALLVEIFVFTVRMAGNFSVDINFIFRLRSFYRAMTQLDLLAECIVPPKESQCYALLMAMKNGERLTVGKALTQYRCYALSQRVGDLKRRYGWPIQSRTVKTAGGANISEYWL